MDRRLICLIERTGYVNERGELVCGTAALLHYVSLMNCPISNLDQSVIDRGRGAVEKYLNT